MSRQDALTNWSMRHPHWVALLLGVLAATGFQPLALWSLGLIGMGGLFALAMTARDWRRAALAGWIFGMGHFTLGNSWIATAFTYQANMPALLGWAAVPLLSLYLALYPALAAGVARRLVPGGVTLPGALLFAGCWVVAEWLRGWVFSGYPWNPFGIVLLGGFDRPGLALLAPWTGTYALSGLAVLASALFVLLLKQGRRIAFVVMAALALLGMYAPPLGTRAEGNLRYTLVQPDLRQEKVDDPSRFEESFQDIAALTMPVQPGTKRLVLWPESAVPDYLREGYPQRYYRRTAYGDPLLARMRIGKVIGPGSMLLTGTVDLEIAEGRAEGARNSVSAIDELGEIRAGYNKAHLVPFGEYLPLRWLLEPLGLSRLVPGAFDFWPGPGARTLGLGDWGRAGIQICYEIVFSGEVVDRDDRPDYIFNPSNDGWFGAFGPPQHFAQARLRAIEEGLPVLRATTTGISGVIDADGIVRAHAGMHRAARLDGAVPPAHAPTLFARLGNMLALAWAAVFLIAGLVLLRRRA